jgi:signal peptidase I
MKKKKIEFPSSELLTEELKRERNKIRYRRILKSTIYALIIVAAVAAIIATLVLPVLQISGTSMEPTLQNGEIVVLVKTSDLEYGDLCAFAYSNKVLIKRVIGLPGDTVVVDKEGTVYINGYALEEPYIDEKGFGECDVEFPYTVPENEFFLMGDQRTTSIDSRSTVIGCVTREQIIGKLYFKIWPLKKFEILG